MSYEKKVRKAGQQYSNAIAQNTESAAAQLESLSSEHQQELKRINDEQQAAEDASIAAVQAAQQEAEKNGAERLIELGNQIRNAKQEGAAQVEAAQQAARWTGAGELAAAVANMIAVGSGNAASQTYHSYSQDWMQKADRDMREHRARIDNLNERLRVQRERLDALRMGNAQTLEGMRSAAAGRRANAAITAANAGYGASVEAAKLRAGGAEKAAAAAYQGEQNAVSVGMHEDAAQQSKAQFAATMAAKGFNADGTINKTLYAELQKAASSSSGGSGKEMAYPIMDADGKVNVAYMKPEEMKGLLTFAESVIRDDLGESEAKAFNKEFNRAADSAEKNAVLVRWMKKSQSVGAAISLIDANYKAKHGTNVALARERLEQAGNPDAPSNKPPTSENVGDGGGAVSFKSAADWQSKYRKEQ